MSQQQQKNVDYIDTRETTLHYWNFPLPPLESDLLSPSSSACLSPGPVQGPQSPAARLAWGSEAAELGWPSSRHCWPAPCTPRGLQPQQLGPAGVPGSSRSQQVKAGTLRNYRRGQPDPRSTVGENHDPRRPRLGTRTPKLHFSPALGRTAAGSLSLRHAKQDPAGKGAELSHGALEH